MAESPFPVQPYQGIATFGRRPHTREIGAADVAIVGVPYDGATSYRSGTRLGPRAIREQSLLLWGYNNALGVAPFEALRVIDYGDIDVVPVDVLATQIAIERDVKRIVAAAVRVVTLGGDHSISLPLLRAHASKYGRLAVVHFDAHPDTWDAEFGEHRYSHGTPFRRAIEEGLIDTAAYFQVGIRGPTGGPQDYADALRLGARMITLEEGLERGIAAVVEEIVSKVGRRATYVTLDIDAVDPAFAGGGLSVVRSRADHRHPGSESRLRDSVGDGAAPRRRAVAELVRVLARTISNASNSHEFGCRTRTQAQADCPSHDARPAAARKYRPAFSLRTGRAERQYRHWQ
jgi:agmatinase